MYAQGAEAHGDLDKYRLDAEQASLPQGLRALRGEAPPRLQTRDLNGYRRHTRDALYAIPPLLVEDIFEWAHGQNYARSGPEWLDPDEF